MNTQRWMSRQFFSFFVTWGIFLPYWTGWMIHMKGVTVAQASLIMSIGLVARGLSTLIMFPALSGTFSSKLLLNGAAIGSLIALLCYIPVHSFGSLLAVTILFHFFYPALMPALESTAGILVQRQQLRHYGKSRLWGSVGFVVSGLILTVFTASIGETVILWAMLLGITVFVCLGFMRAPAALSDRPQADKSTRNGIFTLFQIKHFPLVLIIVILLQSSHASYYNYGYIYLQEMHAPTYFIGIIINIAVLAEIIFFAVADRKLHHFSTSSLLMFAGLGSSLRWILMFSFPNVIVFSIAQMLHACSFAMGHYAFMKYLINHVPHEQVPKAQGLYSALALSWSTAMLTIWGGYLYEIKPNYAFLGMIVCTLPATLLALAYRKLEARTSVNTTL